MTIKSQGGVFGRNPEFNNVDLSGALSVDGNIVTTNGRLGVGTSNPAYPLDVVTSGTNGGRITTAEYGQFFVTDGLRSLYLQNYVGVGSIGTSTNNALTFAVNSSERMRLDTGGNLSINTGNLVIGTSGNGIDFSATAGTGTSELFDDYEEGTWTPAWTNLTVGDGTSTGRYTKFGRTVFVEVDFLLGSTSVVGSSPEINNLPFASAADFLSFGVGSYTDAGTNTDQASCTVISNSNRLIPSRYNISAPRAYQAPISATTPFTWAANDRIRLSVTYTAAG